MKSLLLRPQLDRDNVKFAVFVFVGVVWGTGRVGGRLMFVMLGTCDDCVFGGPSVTFCHGFRLRHAAIRSSQCWAPVSQCIRYNSASSV